MADWLAETRAAWAERPGEPVARWRPREPVSGRSSGLWESWEAWPLLYAEGEVVVAVPFHLHSVLQDREGDSRGSWPAYVLWSRDPLLCHDRVQLAAVASTLREVSGQITFVPGLSHLHGLGFDLARGPLRRRVPRQLARGRVVWLQRMAIDPVLVGEALRPTAGFPLVVPPVDQPELTEHAVAIPRLPLRA